MKEMSFAIIVADIARTQGYPKILYSWNFRVYPRSINHLKGFWGNFYVRDLKGLKFLLSKYIERDMGLMIFSIPKFMSWMGGDKLWF